MATEKWNGVTVKFQYLPKGTRRYGEKLIGGKPKFLVAHDTGNEDTTAQNNVTYYKNTYDEPWDSVASAHIFVDDKEAIVCIPLNEKAWHVLFGATTDNLWYGLDANDAAIGIEMSYFKDKTRSKKSLDNGARILAYLADKYKIDYKTAMPGHQDIQEGKQDPGNVLSAAGYGRNTSNLDKIVAKYVTGVSSEPKAVIPDEKVIKSAITQKDQVKWLQQSIGKKYDADGFFGYQCYDYANAGWSNVFPNTKLSGLFAKNIATDNKTLFSTRATVYKNTPEFLALPGDMVIFPGTFGNGAGHVAWVLSATLNSITVVEQNWLGGGFTSGNDKGGTGWETATKRVHDYDANMVFVRPNYASNKVSATVRKVTNKVKAPKTVWNLKGRFIPNITIKVRKSPGLSGEVVEKGSWLYNKNDWVDFVSVTKKDGYWWIKFKYPTNPSAGYFYCAVCKITDKQERIKVEKYWGKLKWNWHD